MSTVRKSKLINGTKPDEDLIKVLEDTLKALKEGKLLALGISSVFIKEIDPDTGELGLRSLSGALAMLTSELPPDMVITAIDQMLVSTSNILENMPKDPHVAAFVRAHTVQIPKVEGEPN